MNRSRRDRVPEPEIRVQIENLGHDGRGVARVEGKTTFVRDALPGETVRIRRTRRSRHFDEADLVAVELASEDRVTPACIHFGVCGGCVLQHLDAEAQVRAKHQHLAENLMRIGKLAPREWLAPLRGDLWGYRRRGRLSARFIDRKSRLLLGFRERNGKFVADLEQCPVMAPAIARHLPRLAESLNQLSISRQVPQVEFAAGDASAVVVVRHLAPLTDADRSILAEFEASTELAVLLQSGGPDSVVPLTAMPDPLYFRVDDGRIRLDFQPLDFVQVNASINDRMIAHAIALLDPKPHETALELFCGLGNFTLPLALRCARVTAVEGDRDLIERARANALSNHIANADFQMADLFASAPAGPWMDRHYDLMLLDPPRAGAQEILQLLPRRHVRRVVYVSCHPASLARDAAILVERHGFTLQAAGVMDMFPHTAHIESIAVLDREPRR